MWLPNLCRGISLEMLHSTLLLIATESPKVPRCDGLRQFVIPAPRDSGGVSAIELSCKPSAAPTKLFLIEPKTPCTLDPLPRISDGLGRRDP